MKKKEKSNPFSPARRLMKRYIMAMLLVAVLVSVGQGLIQWEFSRKNQVLGFMDVFAREKKIAKNIFDAALKADESPDEGERRENIVKLENGLLECEKRFPEFMAAVGRLGSNETWATLVEPLKSRLGRIHGLGRQLASVIQSGGSLKDVKVYLHEIIEETADHMNSLNDVIIKAERDRVPLVAKVRKFEFFLWVVILVVLVAEFFVVLRPITQDVGEKINQLKVANEEKAEVLKKLDLAVVRAEEAAEAKSSFLATMSHEIRTPLNGVLGMVQILDKTMLSHDQRIYLNTIKSSGNVLLSIINDVLDFSKLEAGRMQIRETLFNLRDSIQEVVDVFMVKVVMKGIELKYNVDEIVPAHIVGDKERITQILMNLVGNAVKFTEKGEIRLTIQKERLDEEEGIWGRGEKDRMKLRFSVKDSGIGIVQDKIKYLFRTFSQVHAEGVGKYGGTGLGLAICKRLVLLMGGEISVESKKGEGSTFSFSIITREVSLRDEASESKEAAVSGAVEEEGPGVRQEKSVSTKVLIVEDNAVNVRVLLLVLKRLGYSADVAADGLEALQYLQSEQYDIIFMDMRMPVIDGWEATRRIRDNKEISPQPVIIAFTASVTMEERERCKEAGVNDILAKPIEMQKVIEILDKYSERMSDAGLKKKTLT